MTTPPADGPPAGVGDEDEQVDTVAVPDADADDAEPPAPPRSIPPSDVVARMVPSSLRTFLS